MEETKKQTFLLIPGAWMGAWEWDKLSKELKELGHGVYSITLSGLGESEQREDVNLETHVNDVIAYIKNNELQDIVLVGHSYSGAVVGQVTDRIPERIMRLIFIEAALPLNGKNMLESYGNDVAMEAKAIEDNNGLWPHPTADELQHEEFLTTDQKEHLLEHFVEHPGKTVTEPAAIKHEEIAIPSLFIGAKPSDRANESVFTNIEYKKIEGGHWPMITKPKELAKLMVQY